MKKWSKDKYGDLDRKIEQLSLEQEKLFGISEIRSLNVEELNRQKAIFVFLQKLMVRKEKIWRQKARIQNLKLKDSNTKLFHAIANVRRRRKQISTLKIGNRVVQGVYGLKKVVEKCIKEHFSDERKPIIQLPRNEMRKFSKEDAQNLEKLPTLEELKEAV